MVVGRKCSATVPRARPIDFISLFACLLLLACQSTGATDSGSDAKDSSPARLDTGAFSARIAWRHQLALNRFGSRVSGSDGSQHTREYLRAILGRLDIEPREQRVSVSLGSEQETDLVHLTAVIPGYSPDILLLAAHYDTSPEIPDPPGARDPRASGSALLLELARVLQAGPTPEYTLWLSWIDGDALLPPATSDRPAQVRLGTQSLVKSWQSDRAFAHIRVAIFFGNVGDNERPLVRDINSPRIYREIFWQVADELGFGDSFPADANYGRSSTGRSVLADAGLRSSIALANQRHPQPESANRGSQFSASTQIMLPHPDPWAGLAAVGNVTLDALTRIAGKLRKIDRFARSPLTAGRGGAADFRVQIEDKLPIAAR